MAHHENHFEQPIASIDEQLASALFQLDQYITTATRLKVGEGVYEEYLQLKALDTSLDAALSEETKDMIVRARAEEVERHTAEAAKQLPDDVNTPFDEDEERAQMEATYLSKLSRIVEDDIEQWDDPIITAFGEVTQRMSDQLEMLLADRYPELEIATLDEGKITFDLKGFPPDYVNNMNKNLAITFTAQAQDIITTVAYWYVPRTFMQGRIYREEIPLASLEDGRIEHISLDKLKVDALRAIQIALNSSGNPEE